MIGYILHLHKKRFVSISAASQGQLPVYIDGRVRQERTSRIIIIMVNATKINADSFHRGCPTLVLMYESCGAKLKTLYSDLMTPSGNEPEVPLAYFIQPSGQNDNFLISITTHI